MRTLSPLGVKVGGCFGGFCGWVGVFGGFVGGWVDVLRGFVGGWVFWGVWGGFCG